MTFAGYDLSVILDSPEPNNLELGPNLSTDVNDFVLKMPSPPLWQISESDNTYLLDLKYVNDYYESIKNESLDVWERFKKTICYTVYQFLLEEHPSGFILFESRSLMLKMKTPKFRLLCTKDYKLRNERLRHFPLRVYTDETRRIFDLYADLSLHTGSVINDKLRKHNIPLTVALPYAKMMVPERIQKRIGLSVQGKTISHINYILHEKVDDMFALRTLQNINHFDGDEIVIDTYSDGPLFDLFELLVTCKLYPSYVEECLLYFIVLDGNNNKFSFRRFEASHFFETDYYEAFSKLMDSFDMRMNTFQNKISRFLDEVGLVGFDGRKKVNVERMIVLSDIITHSPINKATTFSDYFSKLRDKGLVSTTISMYDLIR